MWPGMWGVSKKYEPLKIYAEFVREYLLIHLVMYSPNKS